MDAKAFSSAISKFSTKFCNELNKSKDVVCSPLSAEYLLALLTLGATDPAHKELLTSLGLPDDDSIRSSFTTLTTKLKSIEGVTLDVANRVYLNEGPYELTPELRRDAVKVFDITFEKLNFDNGPASALEINEWVASETKDRIKDLLASDSINSSSRIVLISAMYFEGLWKSGFNSTITKKQTFYKNKQETVEVPMMYKEDTFRFGVSNKLEAQILEMHYKDNQASMIFVLPNKIEGLNTVLQKLADGYDLMTEIDKMISTTVQVTIPKYKIETEAKLTEILPKLGIHKIFDNTDSGLKKLLDNNESLNVTNAVQKVFIEVKEAGAEASTGTGVGVMMYSAGSTNSQRFHADRPFLFVLTGPDRATLLVGAYRGVA